MRDDRRGSARLTGAPARAPAHTVRRDRAPLAWRRPAAVALGTGGLVLYNWWVAVPFTTHLLTTPDELFSDLEATGRPDASLFQRFDLAAGIVLIAALLLRGRRGPAGARAEWPWLVAFAAAGAVGGRFAYACPEGLSAACRSAEWRLALPPHHYVHVLAGIVEFTTATVAVYLAWQRTRPLERPTTRVVRWTGRTLVAAYPLLGYAYLTDRMGVFVEPVFFVCFSVMVAVELSEPDRGGLPDGRGGERRARAAAAGPSPARPLAWLPGAEDGRVPRSRVRTARSTGAVVTAEGAEDVQVTVHGDGRPARERSGPVPWE